MQQLRERKLQKVSPHNFDVPITRIGDAQFVGQHLIEFRSYKLSSARGQERGERSGARADLNNGAIVDVSKCLNNSSRSARVDKEILAETCFTLRVSRAANRVDRLASGH